MDITLVGKIKRLVIIALASDDELMESLVLKGGNAIDLALVHLATYRTIIYGQKYSLTPYLYLYGIHYRQKG